MTTIKLRDRILSVFLCLALLISCLPLSALQVGAATVTLEDGTVSDPGTAHTWEQMMGTDADGNRYAGRVWADKSVYTNGQTAILNTQSAAGSTFRVALENDEAFQVIFSVLGSSMTSKSTIRSNGPLDVVLVLDDSTSMDDQIEGRVTRLEKLIEASNALLKNLTTTADIRIGIVAYNQNAIQVLPFGKYDNGVELKVRNNKYTFDESNRTDKGGTIQAFDADGTLLYNNTTGYARGTNTQAGINMGMNMLENAKDTAGRTPVAIVLTDGAANTAAQNTFYNIDSQTPRSFLNGTTPAGVVLATLLNAAYKKAKVADVYGKAPVIYGIGVDIDGNAAANAVINPGAEKNGFNNKNSSSSITTAYNLYTQWLTGKKVERTESYNGSHKFTFDHGYTGVTLEDIKNNINYVDTYYPVSSAELKSAFQQIYEELSSGVFNPISSSSTVNGATGVDNTPLIYVDFIGQYMEVKDIQAVTLFGSSYDVIKNADGTYTVETAAGINPTTGESYITSEDIKISITEENGLQKLEIRINQEILPIILEQVVSNTVGNETSATINQLTYNPLRVFYTVGLASDILLDNGQVDVTKLDSDYPYIDNTTGQLSFYSNAFGKKNLAAEGDAHIGFQPSKENRYYYHQANQGIFSAVTLKNRAVIDWEADEYGVLYEEGKYDLTWLSYEEYLTKGDEEEIYTYVTYHRPTTDKNDAATAAEEVTYLVYTKWGYLKESVAFYDDSTGKYVNYDAATGRYTLDDKGYVVSAQDIAAYAAANPNAKLYAVLGIGSLRTSRLHNMMVAKEENPTGSADQRYTPEYTYETATIHNGNSVVVWLGNNGRLTTTIDTGIALTKAVTEAIGDPNDTYALTVTLPAGVQAAPVVKDAAGNDVPSTFRENVLTVQVKAGQTVYITGIPAGTVCAIGEVIRGDYRIVEATTTVTVPSLTEVLEGAAQYAPATVTNAPNKYGNLTIFKDVSHHLSTVPEAMEQKVFTFQVQLPVSLAGKTYQVDTENASAFTGTSVTVDADGRFTVMLKDNESITILGLPEGTQYTVTEIGRVAGYQDSTGAVSGLISANGDAQAHFVNTYNTTPTQIHVTVTGSKVLNDIHGTYAGNEEFVFVLSQYLGQDQYKELRRAAIRAGEAYEFTLDMELDLGTYYFRITEESGTTAGMTYDATRGLFAVHVTDEDADGTLEYTVENFANTRVTATNDGFTVTKDFTNTYNVETTFADIQIKKTLHNDTGVAIPLDLFHFQLVSVDDPDAQPIIATTDASGKATIRISELKEGTYRYVLTEVNGGMPGMTYDATAYEITVTVTKEGDQLVAVTTVNGEGDTNTVTVSFENRYALTETHYTPSGEKKLEGPKDLADSRFTFELFETDSSFRISGEAMETVFNNGSAFTFSKITYTQVGTYYYVIREAAGDVTGMTYDATSYHVTVTVDIDPEDATRLAVTHVAINKIGVNSDHSGNIVFVNHYAVKPTQYTISGNKSLTGRAINSGEFHFELYEGSNLLQMVSVHANGMFSFEPRTYTLPGVYVYTIKEVQGNAPGVTYDEAAYTVTVTVTDVDGQLVATADISNDAIVFHNEYHAKPANVTFSGTKTLEGGDLVDGDFEFHLYQTDSSFVISGDPVATVKNENGGFSFEELTFTQAGNYFFVVLEDSTDPQEGIVYDKTQHRFHVQVRDAGDGQLRVSVHNLNTDVSSKSAPSINASVDFVNATSDVVTRKEVYNSDMSINIDGQQVQAGDVLTYVITYTNYTGVDAVVEIRDIIPAHTTYVKGSASHGGTYAGSHIHWILTVGMDESVIVSFQVEVNEVEGVQITNEAVVIEGDNTYTTNEVTNEIPEPEPTEPEPTEPEPTEPEPTEPEPTEPEPTEPEPTEPEPTEPEPTEPEPTEPEPTEPEPTEPEPTEPEPTEPEPTEPEPTEPEPTEPEPTEPEPTEPEPTEPEPTEPEPTEPEPTEPEPTEPEPTEPEPTEPEPTEPEPTEPEPTEPEPTEPEPTEPEPTEPEPTEPEPTEPEPTEPEPTEPEPTEPEPTEPEPTEPEPTEPEPTEPQPEGPPKTGDPTSLGSWFAALFVSGGGVISTIVLGRKRKEQEIQ